MKNKTFVLIAAVWVFALAALGLAAAARAEGGDGSGDNKMVKADVNVQLGDDTTKEPSSSADMKAGEDSSEYFGKNDAQGEDRLPPPGMRFDATSSEDRNGNGSEDSNRGGSAESFKHRQDLEHRSAKSEQDDQSEIEIDQESLDSIDASTTVSDSSEVENDRDLKGFAAGKLRRDDKIDNVRLSSTTVEAEYPTEARLFGFIPATIHATVAVSSDGTVNVSFPWYAFLFATPKDDLHNSVSKAVDTALATTTASGSGNLSAKAQATILSGILSALSGAFGGSR